MNECNSNPCLNGATCIDNIASFTCSCPIGLTGKICETNINDCEVSICIILGYNKFLLIFFNIYNIIHLSFP